MEVTELNWRVSTYSSNGGGSCVEIAPDADGHVLVRDTKQHGHGPVVQVSADAWRAFITNLNRTADTSSL
jgi:hypothetical protein